MNLIASRTGQLLIKRPAVTFFALLVSTSSLLIALLVAVVFQQPLATALTAWQAEAVVFIASETGSAELAELQERFKKLDSVADISYVPRDLALADLVKRNQLSEGIKNLKYNPLPDVLLIKFAADAPLELINNHLATAKQWPKVDVIQFDGQTYQVLYLIKNVVKKTGLLVSALLLLFAATGLLCVPALLVHLSNQEVRVLKLLGAPSQLFTAPAVLAVATLLLIALGLGMTSAFWVTQYFNNMAADLAAVTSTPLALTLPSYAWLAVTALSVLAIGGLVGGLFAQIRMRQVVL